MARTSVAVGSTNNPTAAEVYTYTRGKNTRDNHGFKNEAPVVPGDASEQPLYGSEKPSKAVRNTKKA